MGRPPGGRWYMCSSPRQSPETRSGHRAAADTCAAPLGWVRKQGPATGRRLIHVQHRRRKQRGMKLIPVLGDRRRLGCGVAATADVTVAGWRGQGEAGWGIGRCWILGVGRRLVGLDHRHLRRLREITELLIDKNMNCTTRKITLRRLREITELFIDKNMNCTTRKIIKKYKKT